MPKRAHIVTMDEARATAQLSRQQSALKQRMLQAAPLKGAAKKAARTPGVRKLGQSPRAQEGALAAPTEALRTEPAPLLPMDRLRKAPAPVLGAAPAAVGAPRRGSQPVGPRGGRGLGPAALRGQRASGPVAPRASQPFAAAGGPAAGAMPAARAPRGAREVLRFDEREERAAEAAWADDAAAEPQGASRKPGLVQRITSRFGAKRATAAKARASRSFERQYGGSKAPSAPSEGGPRAAVYQGQMGAKHRRAAQSLASGALGAATAVASSATGRKARGDGQGSGLRLRVVVPAVVAACLVATCVFMYEPVQLWYQEMRENDRLQLEYAALQERNSALQDDVDSLSSEAGIEDRAHQQYGWVRSDERAVSVSGISASKDIDFIANVSPGSVTAPETWYSAFLDPLFGVA